MEIFLFTLFIILSISLIVLVAYYMHKHYKRQRHNQICQKVINNFVKRKPESLYYEDDDEINILNSDSHVESLFDPKSTYDFYCSLGKNVDNQIHYYFKVIDNRSKHDITIYDRYNIYRRTRNNHKKKIRNIQSFIDFVPEKPHYVKVLIINPNASAILKYHNVGEFHIVDYFHRLYGIHIIPLEKIITDSELLEEIR